MTDKKSLTEALVDTVIEDPDAPSDGQAPPQTSAGEPRDGDTKGDDDQR